MPVLDVLSGNQLQAVSGRRGRPVLGDLLLAARADLPGRMAFQQRERELALQEQEQQLQAQALAIQERGQQEAAEAQRRGQRQQVIGTAISGVGQAAQVSLLAKETGVLKSLGIGGGSTASGGSVAAPSTAAGASLAAAEESVGLAGAQSASATAPAAGSLSVLASGAGVAAIGAGAGYGLSKAPIPRYGRALSGAAAGAGMGALAGTLIFPGIGTVAGAIIGGIAGGLTGGLCPVHSAAYGKESIEVGIARQFRDSHLDHAMLRAYFLLYEPVAAQMESDPAYRAHVRTTLIDPLIRYGAWRLGIQYTVPSDRDKRIAEHFLAHLRITGQGMPPFRRKNGEII